jgi:hypothetical protein
MPTQARLRNSEGKGQIANQGGIFNTPTSPQHQPVVQSSFWCI